MSNERPLILITCDDGIESPGLRAAVRAALPLGEVLVPALKTVVLRVDIDAGEMLLSADRMDEVAVFDAD